MTGDFPPSCNVNFLQSNALARVRRRTSTGGVCTSRTLEFSYSNFLQGYYKALVCDIVLEGFPDLLRIERFLQMLYHTIRSMLFITNFQSGTISVYLFKYEYFK